MAVSVFKGLSTLFSIVAVLVCIPTNSVRVFPFLHTLSIGCCVKHGLEGGSGKSRVAVQEAAAVAWESIQDGCTFPLSSELKSDSGTSVGALLTHPG